MCQLSPHIKRLLLVTDAWHPQVNGVVTTLTQLVKHLEHQGVTVLVIEPSDYESIGLPTYREIPLVWRAKHLKARIQAFQPDAIHIATEGGLGWRVRRLALRWKVPFTTAYHTKYPEYIRARAPIPLRWSYALLKFFHTHSHCIFTPAESIQTELYARGFNRLTSMTRGVDTNIFHPKAQFSPAKRAALGLAKTYFLYVGRIAPEKNLDAFLRLDLPGQKVVVGKGPALEALQQQYPDVLFTGPQFGHDLACFYAQAAVFVFPSETDTFGVVNIEAIACGTPVAAFPVTGPKDIITPGINGVLNRDLKTAIMQAQALKSPELADTISAYSWHNAAHQFLSQLAPIESPWPRHSATTQSKKDTRNHA